MIIESISIENFLSHLNSRVCFEDGRLWLISGENGAGKSALFDALEYALYGEHRGGSQQPEILVRHGAKEAVIEVVFRLQGERYRLTHYLDARSGSRGGNRGGRLDRHDGADWQPVAGLDSGVEATWKWLQSRLPSHALFRSGIYLRQGEVDRFLHGTSVHRAKNFAELIDLSAYARLEDRAKEGRKKAAETAKIAEGALRECGEVTDEARALLHLALDAAVSSLAQADAQVTLATAVQAGARGWQQLRQQRQQLQAERVQVEALLAQAKEIRAAGQIVDAWNQAAPLLDAHQRERVRATECRTEATRQRQVGQQERAAAAGRRAAREDAAARQLVLTGTALPEARRVAATTAQQANDLAQEGQIARQVAEALQAATQVRALQDAPQVRERWERREALLPHLDACVRADEELQQAQEVATRRAGAFDTADRLVAPATEAAQAAQLAAEAARSASEEASSGVQQLAEERARLDGQITMRSRLGADAETCPTCAQSLDATAHQHAREMMAAERAGLAAVEQDLAAARAAQDDAVAAANTAHREWQRLSDVANNARTTRQLAQQAADNAAATAARVLQRQQATRAAILAAGAVDAALLDRLTAASLAEERDIVLTGLATARQDEQRLNKANLLLARAEASLTTLRQARKRGTAPLGDDLAAEVIEARQREAVQAREQAANAVEQLVEEEQQLGALLARLDRDLSGCEVRAQAADDAADRAEHEAERAEASRTEFADNLGAGWRAALENDEEVARRRDEAEANAPLAARRTELAGAAGLLIAFEKQAADLDQTERGLDAAQDLPVEDAEQRLATATSHQRDAVGAQRQRESDLVSFEQRRARADDLGQQIERAQAEAETSETLATLLKPRGPIQISIIQRVQEAIAADVNEVLDGLRDNLTIQLGKPRRSSQIEFQDLLIVDRTDLTQELRHFEMISGGEQFRIALAVALSLHRRIGVGGQAGTLIVDEGFGALDAQRRDALARQLTDTTDAILDRGLAHSIIICSHSEEVQRQFPLRWHVEKRSRGASVSRIDAETIDSGSTMP